MNLPTSVLLSVTALMILPGCGLFSSAPTGPKLKQQLVTQVERVHVELELAAEEVGATVQSLEDLSAGRYGEGKGPVEAYADFVAVLDRSEAQAKVLNDTAAPIADLAASSFDNWEKDSEEMTSASLKQRSEERLNRDRERYESMMASVDPSLQEINAFHENMRDFARFLANDLNPSALADIRGDIDVLAESAGALRMSLGLARAAAEEYVQSTAAPAEARPEQQGTPAAPNKGQ